MIKIAKYVAKDGTEFYNKKSCLRYEQMTALKDIQNDYLMLDGHMHQITAVDFNLAVYVEIKTTEAVEKLRDFTKKYFPQLQPSPSAPGKWVYLADGFVNYSFASYLLKTIESHTSNAEEKGC